MQFLAPDMSKNDMSKNDMSHKYHCYVCNYHTSKSVEYTRHLSTSKHSRNQAGTGPAPAKFCCDKCGKGYTTCYGLDKHAETCGIGSGSGSAQPPEYACECGKIYMYRQGLSFHRKKCTFLTSHKYRITDTAPDPTMSAAGTAPTVVPVAPPAAITAVATADTNMDKLIDIMKTQSEMIVKQAESQAELVATTMRDMKEAMSHQAIVTKAVINNSINNNTTNNFNINVFLNENCKDAVNLLDFVNSINCQVSDLEHVGKVGYVEGISKLLIDNLSGLDVTKRPIHCSDTKRMSMYVKDNDEWKRDHNGNEKVRHAIKKVAHKNLMNLAKWKTQYPEHNDIGYGPRKKEYLDIVNNSMQCDTEGTKNEGKILKNVAGMVTIDHEPHGDD